MRAPRWEDVKTNLDAALFYAAKGWYVFPVAPAAGDPKAPADSPEAKAYKASKEPMTEHGKDDATLDTERITAWWTAMPTARIGVHGGPSGLLPVDVDTYKSGRSGLPDASTPWPLTLTALTPSNGKHFYYQLPAMDGAPWTDRRETSTSAVCTKVNGYLILPSPGSGYHWLNPYAEPMDLPDAHLSALLQRESGGAGPRDAGEQGTRMSWLIDQIGLRGLGEYRWKDGGLDSKGRVIAELVRCPFDPDDHSKPYRAIIGIGSAGLPMALCMVDGCAGRAWADLPSPQWDLYAWEDVPANFMDEDCPAIWNAADLARADIPEIETLPLLGCPGYIGIGLSTLIAAYPKSGKTTLVTSLLREWKSLGKRVLYVTEESEILWKHRLHADPDAYDHVWLWLALGTPSDEILSTLTLRDEEIVIVDTLRPFCGWDDEKDNTRVEAAIRPWITACRRSRKTFIGLHHATKAGGEYGRGIAGGHALYGAFDQAIELDFADGGSARRIHASGRLGFLPDLVYRMSGDELVVDEWAGVGEKAGNKADPERVLLAYVEDLGLQVGDKMPGRESTAFRTGLTPAEVRVGVQLLRQAGRIDGEGKAASWLG